MIVAGRPVLCHGDEIVPGAKEQGSVRYGGRGHTGFVHLVDCDHLEFGARLHHIDVTLLTRKVECPVCSHRRC